MIIPTLNAGDTLGPTLAAFGAARGSGLVGDVIVVDGGSSDHTRAVAQAAGARVIAGEKGRGPQLKTGGEAARGEWLLFFHADTVPGPGWEGAVREFISTPANRGRAAAFRYRLDDPGAWPRVVERVVGWRTRALRLPYGDQGLLISRRLYQALGGFRPLAIMEDVDLVRRIGGKRLDILDADAVTSAARYRASGYARRLARNIGCLALYYMKVPPRLIVRLYG